MSVYLMKYLQATEFMSMSFLDKLGSRARLGTLARHQNFEETTHPLLPFSIALVGRCEVTPCSSTTDTSLFIADYYERERKMTHVLYLLLLTSRIETAGRL